MSDVTLRAARPADLPVLASLLGELDSGPPLSIERVTAMLGDMARFPGYQCLIGERRGEPVGTLSMIAFPALSRSARYEAIVDSVVVRGELRGQGIGRAMLAQALVLAAQRGAYKLALSSNSQRIDAHRFYRALGFEQHGLSFSTRTGLVA